MRKRVPCDNQLMTEQRLSPWHDTGGTTPMESAIALLLALIATLAIFDAAGVAYGIDSRDTAPDDHRR